MERLGRLERASRVERLEVTCRRFAVLSGVRQEPSSLTACVQPGAGSRKGTLALLVEPAGDHPSLATEAGTLAKAVLLRHYMADRSLSLTSGLLNALEAANSALLRYSNTGATQEPGEAQEKEPRLLGVQSAGSRVRRLQVGLTAAMLRADGSGVYIAQASPAQAYLRHNGAVAAVPEPAGWHSTAKAGAHGAFTLIKPDDEADLFADGQASDDAQDPSTALDFEAEAMLPPPLGASPGVESDLTYRRVEEGDLILLVSSSLARLLDRATVESLVLNADADRVVEALFELAVREGLAQAHACAVELGGPTSSGLDQDWVEPSIALVKPSGEDSDDWSEPPEDKRQRLVFSPAAPGHAGSGEVNTPAEPPAALEAKAPVEHQEQQVAQDVAAPAALMPTGPVRQAPTLLQQTVYRPVLRAPVLWGEDEEDDAGVEDMSHAWSAPDGEQDEDEPQVFPWEATSDRIPFRPTQPLSRTPATSGSYPAPVLFDPPANRQSVPEAPSPARSARTLGKVDPKLVLHRVAVAGRSSLARLGAAAGGMLPESGGSARRSLVKKLPLPTTWSGPRRLQIRLLTGVALLVVLTLLGLSLWRAFGTGKQVQVNTLLQQAKQEELSANQPGTTDTERLIVLQSALDHAQQAALVEPQSSEAKLLADKVQGELDKARGITRLPQATLLFDLSRAEGTKAGANQAALPNSADAPKAQLSSIVIQGNDAYLLDESQGHIYRCNISAQTCARVLSSGDEAGGLKVGQPVAITTKLGSLIALDDKLNVLTFSPDTSAWQAEQLGDADKLQRPKAIATYDGNLYLLGAELGQVSKYVAGKYGAPPVGWIKDAAALEQAKEPVGLAIDGAVYVLLRDGKILLMQGGKLVRTITPKAAPAGAAPAALYTATDTRDLYVMYPSEGAVTRITKEGQTLETFKGPSSAPQLATLSGLSVDEGRGKLYLVSGSQVYEATMPGVAGTKANPDTAAPPPIGADQQPTPRPTAAP